MSVEGLRTIVSAFSPKETLDRLERDVAERGMTVSARIDHAGAAAKVGIALPPTELLIFGNAKVGTLLMQSSQASGIDLPLKVLAWQDASGACWVSYNEPAWIGDRHELGDNVQPAIAMMSATLRHAVKKAAGHDLEA